MVEKDALAQLNEQFNDDDYALVFALALSIKPRKGEKICAGIPKIYPGVSAEEAFTQSRDLGKAIYAILQKYAPHYAIKSIESPPLQDFDQSSLSPVRVILGYDDNQVATRVHLAVEEDIPEEVSSNTFSGVARFNWGFQNEDAKDPTLQQILKEFSRNFVLRDRLITDPAVPNCWNYALLQKGGSLEGRTLGEGAWNLVADGAKLPMVYK